MAKGPTPSPVNAAALAVFEKSASAFSKITNSLQVIAGMGGQPTSAIAAAGGQIGKVAALFGPWGQAAGAFVSTAAQIPIALKSAADSVRAYVAAFSPLTAQRYDRAWMDLQAAIGRTLLPVLQEATRVVRFFADVTAGVGRVLRPFIEQGIAQLRPLFAEAGTFFKQFVTSGMLVFQAWKPLFDLMGQLTSGPLKVMTSYLAGMAKLFEALNKQLAALFGLKMPDFQSAGLSYASVTTTSVSSMIQSLREKAYQLGGDRPQDKQQQQINILQKLLDTWNPVNIGKAVADEIGKVLPPGLKTALDNLVKAINSLPQFPGVPMPGAGGGGGAAGRGAAGAAFDALKRLPGGFPGMGG